MEEVVSFFEGGTSVENVLLKILKEKNVREPTEVVGVLLLV